MLAEHGNISVGIDLGRDYSQIAFCSKSDRAPLMVMQSVMEVEETDSEDYKKMVKFGIGSIIYSNSGVEVSL